MTGFGPVCHEKSRFSRGGRKIMNLAMLAGAAAILGGCGSSQASRHSPSSISSCNYQQARLRALRVLEKGDTAAHRAQARRILRRARRCS